VHALSWKSALEEWWWEMDWEGLLPTVDRNEAIGEIREEGLVLLDGMENVWFGYFVFSGKDAYVHVVLTLRH